MSDVEISRNKEPKLIFKKENCIDEKKNDMCLIGRDAYVVSYCERREQ
nr:hypothetical protein [uncultured Blautia sp.]